MKISNKQTFTINNLQLLPQQKDKQNKNYNQQNKYSEITSKDFYAYKDFNISFTGRTPEDFYAQDFNRENMPQTMKNYLYYDYEQRQHIPPEQIMQEVFKHLNKAKNLDEVKLHYPNEPLFQNLHELRKNFYTGILPEIALVKQEENLPLFNDGSDDLGLYILKKIYIEGKTLKEINKDFYEKDLNEKYKGLLDKPIDYSVTSAYGIRYPKLDFWHSFIATREEYRKFFITLPKNMVDPNRTTAKVPSERKPVEQTEKPKIEKPRKRKYQIKEHRKKDIKNDIKNSDGSEEEIKKIIKKRFTKNDPEASFIIKYMSPIMIFATDKIHLSEELRYFCENEDENEIDVKNTTMLKRFWKANPALREQFSTAIIDTIDLFEETYDAGGLLPINNNFEIIEQNTENKKAIDYVSQRFVDLLTRSQNVKQKREEEYVRHEQEQALWEEHFKQRYGEAIKEQDTTEISEKIDSTVIDTIKKTALKNGEKIYEFTLENGTKVSIKLNTQEIVKSEISSSFNNMPQSFINKYTNFILKNPKVDDNFLFAFACCFGNMDKWNIICTNNDYSEENKTLNSKEIQEIKSQIMSKEEVIKTMTEIFDEFCEKNPQYIKQLKQAILEYLTQLQVPNKDIIKNLIGVHVDMILKMGFLPEDITPEDKERICMDVYDQIAENMDSLKSQNIIYLDIEQLYQLLHLLKYSKNIQNTPIEIDNIMQKYKNPLTNSERSKITYKFIDILLNMKAKEMKDYKDEDSAALFTAWQELLKKDNSYRKILQKMIKEYIIRPDETTMRYLLDKNADNNLAAGIVEYMYSYFYSRDIIENNVSMDKEIMQKYIEPVDPNLYEKLLKLRQDNIYKSLRLD
ncbi:MAG: hypothetical protein ACI37Q_00980 [Candidatus Gastranaerophilaceae bacterium]